MNQHYHVFTQDAFIAPAEVEATFYTQREARAYAQDEAGAYRDDGYRVQGNARDGYEINSVTTSQLYVARCDDPLCGFDAKRGGA